MKLRKTVVEKFLNLKMTVFSVLIKIYIIYIYIYVYIYMYVYIYIYIYINIIYYIIYIYIYDMHKSIYLCLSIHPSIQIDSPPNLHIECMSLRLFQIEYAINVCNIVPVLRKREIISSRKTLKKLYLFQKGWRFYQYIRQ